MIEVEAITRKWGNSLGITLPKEAVEQGKLKPDMPIHVFIQEKKLDMSKIFGSYKFKKPTQQILDEIREGEE